MGALNSDELEVLLPCAGYATRLYPLTQNFPKALLEVAGKPVLNHILEKLEKLPGVKKAYLVTNARYYPHFEDWKSRQKTHLQIELLNDGTTDENNRLGCIGDINFVIQQKNLKGPLFVIAGDNLFDFSILPMYEHFRKTNKLTISLTEKTNLEDIKRGSCVLINENNKITFFEEKPQNPRSMLHSNTMYIYDKDAVLKLQQYLQEGNNPDQPGRFIQWLYTRKAVFGFVSKGNLIDIGTPEALERARKEFKPKQA